MSIWHAMGFSGQRYLPPVQPRKGEGVRFWRDSPAHVRQFKHAVDVIIPDPRENQLAVIAPASGEVICLVQSNTAWGTTSDFLPYLNYITIKTGVAREFYQLCHIAANSCRFRVGDYVEEGTQLAKTGVNGWMTDPRHIHMMVGIRTAGTWTSVRIRWQ